MPRSVSPNRRALYNMKQGRALTKRGRKRLLRALRKIVDGTDRPPVIALLECLGNWPAIRQVAKESGYRVITGGVGEGRSTALLVRDDVAIHDHGVIGTRKGWRGPKRGFHRGRQFPWATVDLDDVIRTYAAVHMPWNPVKNRAAWNACIRQLVEFAEMVDGHLEYLADWNRRPAAKGVATPRALANRIGGRMVRTGDPLMYVIARDDPDDGIDIIADAKTNEGSDHPYVVVRDIKETR